MKKGNSNEVINTVTGLQKALLFTTYLPSIHKEIEKKKKHQKNREPLFLMLNLLLLNYIATKREEEVWQSNNKACGL